MLVDDSVDVALDVPVVVVVVEPSGVPLSLDTIEVSLCAPLPEVLPASQPGDGRSLLQPSAVLMHALQNSKPCREPQ